VAKRKVGKVGKTGSVEGWKVERSQKMSVKEEIDVDSPSMCLGIASMEGGLNSLNFLSLNNKNQGIFLLKSFRLDACCLTLFFQVLSCFLSLCPPVE